jgi:hypothetical protein
MRTNNIRVFVAMLFYVMNTRIKKINLNNIAILIYLLLLIR